MWDQFMKILFLAPRASVDNAHIAKGFFFPPLSLSILEALTPEWIAVETVYEEKGDVDLNTDADLIGITCLTANASRTYRLAEEFRKRKKTVVLGGGATRRCFPRKRGAMPTRSSSERPKASGPDCSTISQKVD
jgi:hypothetical protein